MGYRDTALWRNSFLNDEHEAVAQRQELIKSFEKSRENVQYLLEKIRKDFPSLTVHDVSHVDGLWHVGSVIAGKDYQLNPLEGFVLGCSFLIHDAALSYDVVGGVSVLRETVEWKDYYTDYKSNTSLGIDEQLHEADFSTMRALHAKCAEHLCYQLFTRDDGTTFYIIENESLRIHLGSLIGRIASSHHWSIDKVDELEVQIPALAGYPATWRIAPIKLACILRCADAGHIDAGRAPDYLMHLLTINGVSRDHWMAQNKLTQIDQDITDPTKVVICSCDGFSEKDFSAWNVACDAIQVLQKEITNSNDILAKHGITTFLAKGVTGADSRENLSRYIKTDGWMPFDAKLHISNVEELIKNLGGEKLYGSKNRIETVLRELIQNSRDAIVARRNREERYAGKIIVSVKNENGKTWFTVSDDGVGMSMQTIKDYFLNFGSSFWASDLAKAEYPGLNASGYKSIGRFGIGFYSVFMVASEVIVNTRKYDEGLGNNRTIVFPSGLCLRPIIKLSSSNTTNVTTSVSFALNDNNVWRSMQMVQPGIMGERSFDVPYQSILSRLTAGLDVDVFYSECEKKEKKVHTNINKIKPGTKKSLNWLKEISFANSHGKQYEEYLINNYTRLRRIIHSGKCYGMAAVDTKWDSRSAYYGAVTVGGLSSWGGVGECDNEFIGYILTEPSTAKRDSAIDYKVLSEWAQEQYNILVSRGLSEDDRYHLPYLLGRYNINTSDVMKIIVAERGKGFLGYGLRELIEELKNNNKKLLLPLSCFGDDRIESNIVPIQVDHMLNLDELLFIPVKNSGFLSLKEDDAAFPINFWNCFYKCCEQLSFMIKKEIVDNRAFSSFGRGKVAIISVN